MTISISDFVASIRTISDVRNMDEFNPIAVRIAHPVSAAEFTIIAAVRPPSSFLVPLYGIWINFDPASVDYEKVFRAHSFDHTGTAQWEEVYTYDDIFRFDQVFILAAGPAGPVGPQGPEGPQGPRGPQGTAGVGGAGPQGETGPPGERGLQGIQGPQGAQGFKGDKGDRGEKGDKGDRGDAGADGAQGIQGERGERGEKGDKGDRGDTGETGADAELNTGGRAGTVGYAVDGDNNSLYFRTIATPYPVVESEYDLVRLRNSDNIEFAKAFTSWRRFSHGIVNSGAQPNAPDELSSWTYDIATNRIVSPINSVSYLGFISPNKYERYTADVVLSSSDADDDSLGFVIAFALDSAGREHTLSVIRNAYVSGAANVVEYNYAIIYNAFQPDAVVLEQIDCDPTDTAIVGWLNRSCRVRVERNDDLITVWTTPLDATLPPMDATGGIDVSTKIEISIGDNPLLEIFDGACSIGFSAHSQRHATFSDLVLQTRGTQYVDARSGLFYVYNSADDTTELLDDVTGASVIGAGRIAYSTLTDRLYFVETNGSFTRIKSNADDAALGRDRVFVTYPVAHGLTVGNVVTVNAAGTIMRSDPNIPALARAIGIVLDTPSELHALISFAPCRCPVVDTVTVGAVMYVSPAQPGFFTATQPTGGAVSIPCAVGMDGNTVAFIPKI